MQLTPSIAAVPMAALVAACSPPQADVQPAAAARVQPAPGQPCPMLDARSPRARAARFSATATLQGVSFASQGGSQACATDSGGDAACEVAGGGVVRVSGPAGPIAYFDIPAGAGARVSMSHDIARCVLN
jgi:hypothetical protein